MILKQPGLLSVAGRAMIGQCSRRTYLKKSRGYEFVYRGNFDYHDPHKYPKRFSYFREEELLDEVHSIRALKIEEPSPFHVVRLMKPMGGSPWFQKVTLRRLNLHSNRIGECSIVPNTPQFNDMLSRVKHLITLVPAKFPNGKIPKEEDIGALKVCPYTGNITIDEKLRLHEKRLGLEKPLLFQGNHLRAKINYMYGLGHNSYIK